MPTSSTVTALRMPPALSKAQGKLRSPAPRADFSMMKMAPMEPSRGPAATSSGGLAEAEASRLMLSRANSSMLHPKLTAGHTDAHARSQATYIHPRELLVSSQPLPEHGAVLCGPGRSLGKVSRMEGGGRGGARWRAPAAAFRCCSETVPNPSERTTGDFLCDVLNGILIVTVRCSGVPWRQSFCESSVNENASSLPQLKSKSVS